MQPRMTTQNAIYTVRVATQNATELTISAAALLAPALPVWRAPRHPSDRWGGENMTTSELRIRDFTMTRVKLTGRRRDVSG